MKERKTLVERLRALARGTLRTAAGTTAIVVVALAWSLAGSSPAGRSSRRSSSFSASPPRRSVTPGTTRSRISASWCSPPSPSNASPA
mgnify:CR=1 FL=1